MKQKKGEWEIELSHYWDEYYGDVSGYCCQAYAKCSVCGKRVFVVRKPVSIPEEFYDEDWQYRSDYGIDKKMVEEAVIAEIEESWDEKFCPHCFRKMIGKRVHREF